MQSRVSALLLATGQSRWNGLSKQLLPILDRPAVIRCIETIQAAGIVDVIVVVGQDGEVAQTVAAYPVTIILNDDQASGMVGSVRAGLSAIGIGSERVFVCLSDQPLVDPHTLIAMNTQAKAYPGSIIVPCYQGQKGNPKLFPRPLLQQIMVLDSLREIIDRFPDKVRILDLDDEGTVLDMDTWENYQSIMTRSQAMKGVSLLGKGRQGRSV